MADRRLFDAQRSDVGSVRRVAVDDHVFAGFFVDFEVITADRRIADGEVVVIDRPDPDRVLLRLDGSTHVGSAGDGYAATLVNQRTPLSHIGFAGLGEL